MKICIDRGFYKFFPENPMDLAIANSRGLGLVAHKGYYTFAALTSAPTYSLVGKDLATAQYAGEPEAVMEVNKWVYSLASGKIVPANTITSGAGISFDRTRSTRIGIPQAGALLDRSNRLASCEIKWRPENNACLIQGVKAWSI
jgi:hypothetical protein